MNKERLERIRMFAEINWNKDESEQIFVEAKDRALTNPWVDYSGRFTLSDEAAVKEWGLDAVIEFCKLAEQKMEENPTLCGFVWCHGEKDFSAWEVALKPEDQEAIEKILDKYAMDGSSERNVWDSKFRDIFNTRY